MPTVTVTVGEGKKQRTIRISGVAEADGPHVSVKDFCEKNGDAGLQWTSDIISKKLHELDGMEQPWVCCALGMNRSPTMAIFWLWKSTGETLGKVIEAVQAAYTKQAGGAYSKLVQGLIDDVLKPSGRRATLNLQAVYDSRWG